MHFFAHLGMKGKHRPFDRVTYSLAQQLSCYCANINEDKQLGYPKKTEQATTVYY